MDYTKIPALKPPPGVKSNFVDPSSYDGAGIATTAICVTLVTLAVGARLVTKGWVMKKLATEDYMMAITWAGFVAYNGIVLKDGLQGYNRHQWDVSLAAAMDINKRANIGKTMYGLVMWFAKAALVFQLLHIFTPNFRGPFFWSLHALLWMNLLFYTGGAFAVLFQCIPREKIWNPAVTGTCIDVEIYFIATSVVNIVSDVSLLLLPITVIWNLKMDLKKKFSVSVVFATGLFACISSVVRLVYTFRLFKDDDKMYLTGQVGLWSVAELTTVILCGCFPVLPRFFQAMLGRVRQVPSKSSLYHQTLESRDTSRRTRGTSTLHGTFNHADDGSEERMMAHPNGSYIKLRERPTNFNFTQSATTTSEIVSESRPVPEKIVPGIRKTVQIETTRELKGEQKLPPEDYGENSTYHPAQ